MSSISTPEMGRRIAEQQRLIGEMRQMSADLTQPTDVCHMLAFPSQETADYAMNRLKASEFQVTTLSDDVVGEWLVFAGNEQVLNAHYLALVRIAMERLAAELGGRYDDWEAAIRVEDWPNCGCEWPNDLL